jgi:hypothetical protein
MYVIWGQKYRIDTPECGMSEICLKTCDGGCTISSSNPGGAEQSPQEGQP